MTIAEFRVILNESQSQLGPQGPRNVKQKMVGRVSLELTPNSLKGYCSTIELPTLGRGGQNRTVE